MPQIVRELSKERSLASQSLETKANPAMPLAPKMRVVQKGLFSLREFSETTDQAEKENEARRARRGL